MKKFKCISCGGDNIVLSFVPGMLRCKLCGTNTQASVYDNQVQTILSNAVNLRSHFLFDRAIEEYKNALRLNPEAYDAFFGIALSKYGVEYEIDGEGNYKVVARKFIEEFPLINTDYDLKKAISMAPEAIQNDYVKVAKEIYKLQKELSVLKRNNYKFDVYVSYTAKDLRTGEASEDSKMAKEVYDWLTSKGLKVFMKDITLSKIPTEKHEPYIHSAIINSKCMVAVTSSAYQIMSYEQKAEWGKFNDLILRGKKDVDALILAVSEEVPDVLPNVFEMKNTAFVGRFGGLQNLLQFVGQTLKVDFHLGEITFDSLRGKGHLEDDPHHLTNQLMLTNISLLDEQFVTAKERALEIINYRRDSAQAYLYLLLAEHECSRVKDLLVKKDKFWETAAYEKYLLFAKPEEKEAIMRAVRERQNNTLDSEKEKVEQLLGSSDEQSIEIAIQKLKEQVQLNNIDAMLRLAQCYEQGAGVVQSFDEAAKWYQVAEDNHSMVASYKLAQYYENGLGVERDKTEAVYHYSKAAERGHIDSLYTLAEYYLTGEGIDKNENTAVRLFRQASKEGHLEANFQLAICFRDGKGVIAANDVAFKLFREGAEKGHIASKEIVIKMLQAGLGDGGKSEIKKWKQSLKKDYGNISTQSTAEEKEVAKALKEEKAAAKEELKNAKEDAKAAKKAAKLDEKALAAKEKEAQSEASKSENNEESAKKDESEDEKIENDNETSNE